MDVVGFECYMNGNIINGSSGIEYDIQPCLHINILRQIEFNEFIETLCDALSIDKNDGIEVIFRYGSYMAGSTFYIPISLRSEPDLRFMMSNAPPLPHTVELYISQPNLSSSTQMIEDINEFETHNEEDDCFDPTIATNAEEVEVDDDGSDLDRPPAELFDVHDVPEVFNQIDLNYMNTSFDTSLNIENSGYDDLMIGMVFNSKEELKNAVKRYTIMRHQDFEVIESKRDVWAIRCKRYATDCTWRLRAIRKKKHEKFEITQYNGPHSCLYARLSQNHNQLDSNLIAAELSTIMKNDPSISVPTLQNMILKKYGYFVSYWKVWDGKRKAIQNLFGEWRESYNLLPKWMSVLEKTNPGTVVDWRLTEIESDNRLVMFNSVFWSFGPAIEGFQHCRPLLQIDGTHLYGKYEGKLLVATSVDANSHVYPLAYAIVPEESADSWGWFLRNVWEHVVCRRSGLCIISDRHKGILSALQNPNNGWADAHHRFCLRHVASNFNDKYKNGVLKSMVYRAGSQYQFRKFNQCMDELREANPRCLQWFVNLDVKQWTQSHDGGHRYGWLTTNVAECVNAVLKRARKLPITALAQATFYRTVAYFAARRVEIEAALESGESFTRYAIKKLRHWEGRANTHEVNIYDHRTGLCDVTSSINSLTLKGGSTHRVKLSEQTCTCNKWQSYGIPCSHAIATCRNLGVDYLCYIEHYYKISTYMSCYSPQFEPIPDRQCWPDPNFPFIYPDETTIRSAGRPCTSRIHNEMDRRDATVPSRCTICRQEGHNRRKCPRRGGNET